mmetsp:Transcript_3413/g.8656  ORF Transcript_3413/g.8656 Transcript_3413/m.8656 type:complete len:233 (+) Transcript_3413:272-970(+)
MGSQAPNAAEQHRVRGNLIACTSVCIACVRVGRCWGLVEETLSGAARWPGGRVAWRGDRAPVAPPRCRARSVSQWKPAQGSTTGGPSPAPGTPDRNRRCSKRNFRCAAWQSNARTASTQGAWDGAPHSATAAPRLATASATASLPAAWESLAKSDSVRRQLRQCFVCVFQRSSSCACVTSALWNGIAPPQGPPDANLLSHRRKATMPWSLGVSSAYSLVQSPIGRVWLRFCM